MSSILNRCKCALIITILLYVQTFVYCSFEFLNISFGALSKDTGLIFVGLMLITTYFYIICLPTTIVPKITSIRLIFIVIVTIFISIFINATIKINYIIENVILTLSFFWIVWRLSKCAKKVKTLNITSYVLHEFRVYKLHELNLLNLALFLCIVGAAALLGCTITTACYAIALVAILLFNNYSRMFHANLSFGSRKWYFTESLGIILTVIYILIAGYLEWRIWFKVIAIVPASLYFYSSYKLWREYHAYLNVG